MACCHPDAQKPVNCGWKCHYGCKFEMPKGWKLNPDEKRVESIRRALERTGGDCPCVPHTEWNESTICPCEKFRAGEGCHCGLFVKEDSE